VHPERIFCTLQGSESAQINVIMDRSSNVVLVCSCLSALSDSRALWASLVLLRRVWICSNSMTVKTLVSFGFLSHAHTKFEPDGMSLKSLVLPVTVVRSNFNLLNFSRGSVGLKLTFGYLLSSLRYFTCFRRLWPTGVRAMIQLTWRSDYMFYF